MLRRDTSARFIKDEHYAGFWKRRVTHYTYMFYCSGASNFFDVPGTTRTPDLRKYTCIHSDIAKH
jgi:hypothetical protein